MNPKTLATVLLVGAIASGWFAYTTMEWADIILAVVLLVMSVHYYQE